MSFVLAAAAALLALGQVSQDVSDAGITARIETLYLVNQHLSPFNINTTTKDGVVTITGSVIDEVQKELAEEIAVSVDGVKSVNNQLTVVPTVYGEKERRSFRTKLDDKTLAATVRSRLIYHREFKGFRIGVAAVNSVVTLHGVVDTETQKARMGEIAEETRGVERVINNLTVRPRESATVPQAVGRTFSDEWYETRVEAAILVNRNLSIRELDVEVNDGVCILTGTVGSEAQKTLAGDLAQSVQGVKRVQNDIQVRPEYAPAPKAEPVPEPAPEPEAAAPELHGIDPQEEIIVDAQPLPSP